jgi:adenylate kinase family enzyme
VKYKNKTNSSRKPARVLLCGPPCSKKSEIAQLLAKRYNLASVSMSDLLNKEINNKNDNSISILRNVNEGELVGDKFCEKLVEDRLFASDAMINGWILTGFPKNKSQLYFMLNNQNYCLTPSLMVMLDLEDDYVVKRSNLKRIDPVTGKVYYIDSKDFNKINAAIGNRLVKKNEDREEILKKRLENWKNFSMECQDLKINLLRLNGESSVDEIIKKIANAMENDS